MTALENHLEQITVSARSLSELEFPPSKLFVNALLGHHEITTLIRDTEPHERALFSIDPDAASNRVSISSRRTTMFGRDVPGRRKSTHPAQQRQSSTVAKVLGSDMLRQIQQSSRSHGKRGVDVEILLQGAERLCAVYSVVGANERIASLRDRHAQIARSVAEYEAKVAQQQLKVNRMNSGVNVDTLSDDDTRNVPISLNTTETLSLADLQAEEEEIRELEARKKALEERVAEMGKDLGGLLR